MVDMPARILPRLAPLQLHPKLMNDALGLECVAVVHCFFLQFNAYRYVDFRVCGTWVDLLPFHNNGFGLQRELMSVLGLGLTPFTARGWSSHPFGLSLGKALP